MKLLVYISFLSISSWSTSIMTPTHDVTMAMFRISESEEGIELDVTLDLEDYCNDRNTVASALNLKGFQSYLDRNIILKFNNNKATLKLKEFNIEKDHIRVKGNLGKLNAKINSIEIRNTCLINIVKHSNIIQIDLNDRFRDFRMHKERTVILVEY